MSSSSDGLSREEFLRLQEQLIELRNSNYELKEKLKNAVSSSNEPATKKDPLQFASRLLNRSLTEKEKETQQRLEGENEDLRTKLNQQEEEFRLQQQTFIEELNKVVRQCEGLQKELETKQREHPLQIEAGDRGQLEEERRQWAAEKAILEEKIEEWRDKLAEKTMGLEEQTVCVKGLENTLLEVRRENEEQQNKWREIERQKDKEIQMASERVGEMEEKVDKLTKSLGDKDREIDRLKKELDAARTETKQKMEETDGELQSVRGLYIQEKKEKENILKQLKKTEELHQTEHSAEEERHRREMGKLREEIEEEYAKQILELRNQLDDGKNKNTEEIRQVEEKYQREKEKLEGRIRELEGQLGAENEEKQLALKKQNMLVKELQKALKEEKRRAESVEKAKEKEWHVVDPDARSSNTYDGNESISSLSALESDNVELINKLGTLQKAFADAVDKVRHLEHENECQQREILEKSELIENWIRSRPMPAVSGTQKNENPLRKFLTNTLTGDEQVTDLKEMNRKLQRMLEETLSKNMILQRDLQTLLERTEM